MNVKNVGLLRHSLTANGSGIAEGRGLKEKVSTLCKCPIKVQKIN